MSKKQLLCLLGIWIMVFPFLGFPTPWIKIIALVSGLLVACLAYTFPSQISSGSQNMFVENKKE